MGIWWQTFGDNLGAWRGGATFTHAHLVLPQSAGSVMSHPLGDIFDARSCGAPFSGMNLGTNSSKSASASHPRRRFRTPSRACTHWHRKCPFNGTGSLTKEGVVTCHSQCDGLDKLWDKKTSYGKGREFGIDVTINHWKKQNHSSSDHRGPLLQNVTDVYVYCQGV